MNPITRYDFLSPLFDLHPIVVALIVWLAGWGSLFLIAWREDVIVAGLLKSPGHMIGDFFMLPLAGLLVTSFYHSIADPHPSAASLKVVYAGGAASVLFTFAVTYYSIFVSRHYQGIWSVPHTIFIWFFVYLSATFLIKGALQLSADPKPGLYAMYAGVVLAMAAHVAIKVATSGSLTQIAE